MKSPPRPPSTAQPVTQTKTVHLRAGDQATLAFDLQAQESVETALTLHVPTDANGVPGGQ